MILILFQSLSSAMITKQLSWQTFPSLVRWMSAVARPFPAIQDPLDLSCPQLAESRRRAEEQLAQLEQLNKIALGGGEKMPIFRTHTNHNLTNAFSNWKFCMLKRHIWCMLVLRLGFCYRWDTSVKKYILHIQQWGF